MISTSINKLYSLNCFLYTTYDTTRTTEPTPRENFRRNILIHNHIHKYELVMEILIIDLSTALKCKVKSEVKPLN